MQLGSSTQWAPRFFTSTSDCHFTSVVSASAMHGSAASNAARAFAVLAMVTSLSRWIYACPRTASSVVVRALVLVGFLLAAVDRAVRMLRRGVDRVQAQRLALRGIHHVVLGAARDHYRRAVVQGVALAVDD